MSLSFFKNQKTLKDHLGFIQEKHPLYIYFLSFIVGIASSFATIGFIKFYDLLIRFIYFSSSVNFLEIAETTPFWYFIITLTVGGLLVGLFIYYFVPYHGYGHGFPHLLYSYRHYDYIGVPLGLNATLASSISLGLGTSVGREMPAIFFASSVTSWLAQAFKLSGHYFRLLIAIAVGTALATSVHSSFVGIFFIIEVLSFSLTALDLLPIMLGIFTGSIIRESFPYILPPMYFDVQVPFTTIDLPNFLFLGLLSGFLAYLFVKSLVFTIRSSIQSPLPRWIWPMIGGLAISFVIIQYPQAVGLGFVTMKNLTDIPPAFVPIMMILLAKFLCVLFSLGFGFSGGIFTPSIFLGLCIGSLYAAALSALYPHAHVDYTMYAIAGSAAFAAVVLGAPLTLTFLAFEITTSIEMTLNVFIVVFFAQIVMKSLNMKSFFQSQYLFLYDN